MTSDERSEWLQAIQELHEWNNWFMDVRGSKFCHLWLACLKEAKSA